ncbi:unnamed protein product [Symbiodinium sp. CCMP2592]|nr:unnamed protein product [Symbiodinium sp. CCMP2592]
MQFAILTYWPFEKQPERVSYLQDLLEAAFSKDVDSEIVRNNAYLGVLLHKYACNSAVLRRPTKTGLEALAPELFPSARLSAREAIGTAGYEQKLQRLITEGRFIHPLDGDRPSFADLAHALAWTPGLLGILCRCCGLVPEQPVRAGQAEELAAAIGKARRHIVVVLCDGMGVSTLHQHLAPDSFLRRNNTRQLRAVFPATTPAALTTLATAAWPGQHGLPGWELRDQKGCEFPGAAGVGPIQLTILDAVVRDMRTRKPVSDLGFDASDIYIRKPWVSQGESSRRMKFVNAYNGTEFTNWYQDKHCSSVMNIPETALETLGQPEGSQKAVEFFNAGVDAVISSVTESEEEGWQSYVYLYTAHPDKHMHQLGVEHPEVTAVMTGIDKSLSRLWEHLRKLDATLIVTADHGHVTVKPEEMVVLPDDLLNCLEYANVGVHGKGRHAYFHCRSGRLQEFQRLWDTYETLRENFLLLPVDVAAELGLFGPDPPLPEAQIISITVDSESPRGCRDPPPEIFRSVAEMQLRILGSEEPDAESSCTLLLPREAPCGFLRFLICKKFGQDEAALWMGWCQEDLEKLHQEAVTALMPSESHVVLGKLRSDFGAWQRRGLLIMASEFYICPAFIIKKRGVETMMHMWRPGNKAGRATGGWKWLDTDKTGFELLWKRDLLSDQSVALRIPDTIVFKFNYPSVWYFTSLDGTLKRKHKSKLNDEYIFQQFLKRPPACGIVAYYVRTVVDAEDAHKGLAENVPAPTTIEYLNEAQLHDFLFNRQREKGSGLLQKFLEPFGDRNNMIRALWSPKVCLLERRLNCLNLNDTRYDMYERAVTFEGPDFHSEVTPVRGSTLANKVLHIAETIVQHVKGATNDRVDITRLALNFKVDHKDHLYFLFASSVRLSAPTGALPLEVNTKLQVPENIHRAQSVSRVAPAILLRSCSCPTCQEKVHEEMLFDVSYKVIMEYEEQRLSAAKTLLPEAESSPRPQEVPEALQRLHPRLQAAEYATLKNELAFQEKSAAVCENCYLRFSTAQLGPVQRLAAPELRTAMEEALGDAEAALVGTGALDPERLALRREVTRRKILDRRALEDALFDAAEVRVPLRKASSCPRLPSWGPDQQGYPLWAPTPVLRRPPPPKGAPPNATRLREAVTEAPLREKSRSKAQWRSWIQPFFAVVVCSWGKLLNHDATSPLFKRWYRIGKSGPGKNWAV